MKKRTLLLKQSQILPNVCQILLCRFVCAYSTINMNKIIFFESVSTLTKGEYKKYE